MAAKIFHGAPGSFKSASAVWFEMLPALRAGRVVVTNIEGMLTKESIEIELNEVFPDSADIWRLSSQTEKGLFLWRRWFWWMPVKAFIIMDEVQDVFPSDAKVFKPEDLDSEGIDSIKNHLPEKYYNYSVSERKKFTPETDEGSTDDTGELILDDDGFILYPKLMREANMRHRKYNWDIIYCTPEISEIHKLVRSVCEFAYFHKYNESLEFIPYFKRRPRINEHSPKSTGVTAKKGEQVKWRRVPVEVHKCYRSTSTGKTTKAGALNAFKDPTLIFTIALLFLCFSYATWWLFIKEDKATAAERIEESVGKNISLSSEATTKSPNISNITNAIQNSNESPISVDLPYRANEIYFNGYVDIKNKNNRQREYLFTLIKGTEKYYLSGDNLKQMGFVVRFVNECSAKIFKEDNFRYAYCPPRKIEKQRPQGSDVSNST